MNLVDFDVAIFNVAGLTDASILLMGAEYLKKLRTLCARLLASNGQIIAVVGPTKTFKVVNAERTNIAWSPIKYVVKQESGDTVQIEESVEFPAFLKKIKKWNLLFSIAESFVTPELAAVCGSESVTAYYASRYSLAANRYGASIALQTNVSIVPRLPTQGMSPLGNFILLPKLDDLSEQEAIRLILEDLLGRSQSTAPPQWVSELAFPGISELEQKRSANEKIIETLERENQAIDSKKSDIEKYKLLIYGSGVELEIVFAQCLAELGGVILPKTYSEEEFVLQYKEQIYLVECKGVSKSAALSHFRQVTNYVLAYEEKTGKKGKGILLVNAWKDIPLEAREEFFPPNVIENATKFGVGLLSALSFFKAFSEVREGRRTAEDVMDRITLGVGVIDI